MSFVFLLHRLRDILEINSIAAAINSSDL